MEQFKASTLSALQAEIEQKRETAARLEQEHADLELELGAFERLYDAEIKPLQTELDETERHIAEYQLRNELVRFRGNRLSADQLEAEVALRLHRHYDQNPINTSPPRHRLGAEHTQNAPAGWPSDLDTATQTQLKSLYRELAKRFHPDLTADEAERERRSARMAEINAAYACGDLDALRRAAAESDIRPKPSQTLAELLTERDRLDALIARLRQDIAKLNRDPLMLLKIDAALARHDGRDLLAEIATDLHIRLVERRGVLNNLIAEFRALVEQAGLTQA